MKKIIALALVLVFTIALAVPAFAAETAQTLNAGAQNNNHSTNVTYTVQGGYIIDIPATIELNNASECSVSVNNVLLYNNTKLVVTVTYGDISIDGVGNSAVAALVVKKGGEPVASGTELFEFNPGTQKSDAQNSATLTVSVDQSKLKYAGVYTGQITFNANVVSTAQG